MICAVFVAQRLLGKHDINFYLAERPPEFLLAVGIGGLLVIGLAFILLRLFSGWFLALPLIVFESASPRDSLSMSWRRLAGRHWVVVTLLGGWVAARIYYHCDKYIMHRVRGFGTRADGE